MRIVFSFDYAIYRILGKNSDFIIHILEMSSSRKNHPKGLKWMFYFSVHKKRSNNIAILKKSHAQAMEGQAVSMDEVEHYMDTRIYELTSPVDAHCVAEPF